METKKMTYMQAIRMAMDEEMANDEKIFLVGQDVGILGGAYGVTGELYKKYGPERVIDAPLAENAIVGFGIGAAMTGYRPIVEIMKMDFSLVCIDEIVDHMAKYMYMSGGQIKTMPATIRTCIGGGTRSGPHHSQSLYSLYACFPGLRVVIATTPADAKGLLKSAIRSNDPVLFCEPTGAYRIKGEVPVDPDFTIPLGEARIVSEGEDITIVGVSTAIMKATNAIDSLKEADIDPTVIDLRCLNPLDMDPVLESAKKTGRVLVVDDFTESFGITGEIAFRVQEACYNDLKMPVQRLTLPDTIIPAAGPLEDWVFLSADKIAAKAKEMCNK